ncbi:terminase large subunit [Microbacterium esteraromaticum]|uniref:terminase large subunit n=1 Tax=Microbacterium esteraromaticum TaxID=57043 RepID=UPI0023689AA9|nr:terminase large subunit [Microbacterium esteraromaticum]WDH80191.1 terminase large subunit [Microbacterium esteraromaticum]
MARAKSLLGPAYRAAVGAVVPADGVPQYGFTEPRIVTTPLCELTPETSRGFEVIDFAHDVLNVVLFPWERALLIRMLELDAFGLLRFRKALVIVGRQNGKTLMAAVLAAYWLYVDAGRWPQQLPEQNFIVVGAAQKLDIAMKPWKQVRRWGAPDDLKVGIAIDRVPDLQEITYPPRTTNGETELRTHNGAAYLPRTFDGARGQSSARLILDELREQYDYEGWSAIEKSANAMYDSLLVAFSNAGTKRSKVLKGVRETAHAGVDDPETQWFVAEWSAEQDAPLDDPRAFAQANPSAGYLPGMTIAGLMRAAAEAPEKNVERIEVLGQWVTATVDNYIDTATWKSRHMTPADVLAMIPKGARTVWSIDTSHDRKRNWLAAAVFTESGKPFVTIRVKRPGWAWVIPFLIELAQQSGHREVALQSKGVPALDFLKPLQDAEFDVDGRMEKFIVHAVDWSAFALATGRISDRVRDGDIVLIEQPDVDKAIEGAVVRSYAENIGWSREKSLPVDISGVCAMTLALYALEVLEPEPDPEPVKPPPAAAVARADAAPSEQNIARVAF